MGRSGWLLVVAVTFLWGSEASSALRQADLVYTSDVRGTVGICG